MRSARGARAISITRITLLVSLQLALATAALAAQTLHVDAHVTLPPTQQDGTTWESAFADLQAALAVAQDGDEIRLARGTYRPAPPDATDRGAAFQIDRPLTLRGGYAGITADDPDTRDPNAFSTLLSGEIGDPLSSADNCYHVLRFTATSTGATLDGVTITGGNANDVWPNDYGGGMQIDQASIAVIACTFQGNRAIRGAGLGMANGAAPTITDCRFIQNHADESGGGAYGAFGQPRFERCTFADNFASLNGGGVAGYLGSLTLLDCVMEDNFALFRGGGVYASQCDVTVRGGTFTANRVLAQSTGSMGGGAIASERGDVRITNSDFTDNFTSHDGGAVWSERGVLALANCSLVGNTVGGTGGAVYKRYEGLTLANCRLLGNTAGIEGGAVRARDAVTLVANCTIFANETPGSGGGLLIRGGEFALANSILWANADADGTAQPAQLTTLDAPLLNLQRTCVQGWNNTLAGTDMLAADPQFRDPLGPDGMAGTPDDDLLLVHTSPCVDAGDNALVASDEWDLDGDGDTAEPFPLDLKHRARFIDVVTVPDSGCCDPPVVDLGALELDILGDLNCDGYVDVFDISPFVLALLDPAGYAAQYPGCSVLLGDLNEDGLADVFDINPFVDLLLAD